MPSPISVLAQRLIFGHSSAGDLTPFLCAYFDTTTGPKREAESYRRIAAALGEAPDRILFVSDVGAELDAAAEAGLECALCVREGDAGRGRPSRRPPLRRAPVKLEDPRLASAFDETPLWSAPFGLCLLDRVRMAEG